MEIFTYQLMLIFQKIYGIIVNNLKVLFYLYVVIQNDMLNILKINEKRN